MRVQTPDDPTFAPGPWRGDGAGAATMAHPALVADATTSLPPASTMRVQTPDDPTFAPGPWRGDGAGAATMAHPGCGASTLHRRGGRLPGELPADIGAWPDGPLNGSRSAAGWLPRRLRVRCLDAAPAWRSTTWRAAGGYRGLARWPAQRFPAAQAAMAARAATVSALAPPAARAARAALAPTAVPAATVAVAMPATRLRRQWRQGRRRCRPWLHRRRGRQGRRWRQRRWHSSQPHAAVTPRGRGSGGVVGLSGGRSAHGWRDLHTERVPHLPVRAQQPTTCGGDSPRAWIWWCCRTIWWPIRTWLARVRRLDLSTALPEVSDHHRRRAE